MYRPHTAGELRLELQEGPMSLRDWPLVSDCAPGIQRVHTTSHHRIPYHQVHKPARVQPRSTVETKFQRVTEVSRCTQGEIPRTGNGLDVVHLHHRKPGNGQAGSGHAFGGTEQSNKEYGGLRTGCTQKSDNSPDGKCRFKILATCSFLSLSAQSCHRRSHVQTKQSARGTLVFRFRKDSLCAK